MDDSKALSIVSALANGVNPLSGEVFTADSPYQSPEIVRALFVAARALEGTAKPASSAAASRPPRPRTDALSNVGKPWSEEEDHRLLSEFERGQSPHELAAAHGRTLAGVEARLEKHGRLQPQQRVTSNRYGEQRNRQNAEQRTTQAQRSS